MLLNPLCPCGSDLPYANCCGPYLSAKSVAPTAVALMRSRYSAYHKKQIEYLIQTRHSKTRKNNDRVSLLETMEAMQWEGLIILNTQKGTANDRRGIVEFAALYRDIINNDNQSKPSQKINQLHERSRFIKEGDQWFYVDGDILPPVILKPKP